MARFACTGLGGVLLFLSALTVLAVASFHQSFQHSFQQSFQQSLQQNAATKTVGAASTHTALLRRRTASVPGDPPHRPHRADHVRVHVQQWHAAAGPGSSSLRLPVHLPVPSAADGSPIDAGVSSAVQTIPASGGTDASAATNPVPASARAQAAGAAALRGSPTGETLKSPAEETLNPASRGETLPGSVPGQERVANASGGLFSSGGSELHSPGELARTLAKFGGWKDQYVALCLAVRDQHADLREWVDHHMSIGCARTSPLRLGFSLRHQDYMPHEMAKRTAASPTADIASGSETSTLVSWGQWVVRQN